MTIEKAKQKLFTELDKAFSKYGVGTRIGETGFYPHYSEIGSDSMIPTWYTRYKIDEHTLLITMYYTIYDSCISTLFIDGKEPQTKHHGGYPKNIEDAKKLLEILFTDKQQP